ncbi:mechanosensitive ion channel family protein [Arthrobacter rhombi]|uniref:mechanosensitive ion channel family protein n=1 Tax=Arthrobacter rhombi TaxID=71253 RepID=UPI003FD4E703
MPLSFSLAPTTDASPLWDWSFWLDRPLKVAIVIVIGVLLNYIIRRVIRRTTEHIAAGEAAALSKEQRKSEKNGRRWLVQESPIAVARRTQRAQTVGSVLRSVTTIVITAVVLLTVLSQIGINMAPVLASAGVVGVALGFGAQALVKDYLSGIFLVAEDQFGIGDYVDLGEASGEVEAVGLRITQVRDVDGSLWHVRNGEILRVGNFSQGWARAVLDIPVPYDSKMPEVNDLILASAQKLQADPKWSHEILDDPEIWGVQDLSGESITIRLVFRTRPLQQWAVARAMRTQLKTDLDAAGVRIPLVQQTIIHAANPEGFTTAHAGTGPTPDSDPASPTGEPEAHPD